MNAQIPAGWYDDGQGALRWWDGLQWTQNVQPLPSASPANMPGTAGQAYGINPNQASQYGQNFDAPQQSQQYGAQQVADTALHASSALAPGANQTQFGETFHASMSASAKPYVSPLNGNEQYCVDKLGYRAGNMLLGNSVVSMGFMGQIGSGFKGLVGGEIPQITEMIAHGRNLSMSRLAAEMKSADIPAATGMTSSLRFHGHNIEFISVAGGLLPKEGEKTSSFTTASSGQELYCQVDSGYDPISFVTGNVAYSLGVTGGVIGGLKTMKRGEVTEYSDVFNNTRNLALSRIVDEARSVNANAVVGIETEVLPYQATGVYEMFMAGTASHHEMTDPAFANKVTTSDLTAEETWNFASLGLSPLELVLGTSVYSLGLTGGIAAGFKNLQKGEITELTEIIYAARENSLAKLRAQAQAVGADEIAGVKTYIFDLSGNMIEFFAIGTAMKRTADAKTKAEQLMPQAIIKDKETFFSSYRMI